MIAGNPRSAISSLTTASASNFDSFTGRHIRARLGRLFVGDPALDDAQGRERCWCRRPEQRQRQRR